MSENTSRIRRKGSARSRNSESKNKPLVQMAWGQFAYNDPPTEPLN